jgi:hypothetical protein
MTVDAIRCIWCGESDPDADPEHIVPECLGCPPDAVLHRGEVCSRCNNTLSRRDVVLCDGFDLLRLYYGQPGKKGGPPALAGRPNARTHRTGRESSLQLNLGPGPQDLPDGHKLKPPSRNIGSLNGTFERDGQVGKVSFSGHLFYQEHFVRAIYKIALETIALAHGWQAALASEYDPIRAFVLEDKSPQRRCLVTLNPDAHTGKRFTTRLYPPYRPDNGDSGCVVPMRLLNVEFTADCTPDERIVEQMLAMRSFSPDAQVHSTRVLPWHLDPWIKP